MLESQIEYPGFLLPAQESRCCCQRKRAQLAIFEDVEEAVEALVEFLRVEWTT